ncbi:MAG: zf-HC2 domain-containing protein [Planctomycetes bacterium]|nr:zf-HC2 domain-containing protein [Planctomycetota bacterium]
MTCAEILELVHDDIDGRLDPAKREAVDAHVSHCAACAGAARQLRDLRAAFRAMPRVTAPAELRESVLDRLVRARILSLPRMAFPIAAAAALLVGAVVLSRFSNRPDVSVAARDVSERRMPVGEPVPAPSQRTGLTTEDALEGARRSRHEAAGDMAKKLADSADARQDEPLAPGEKARVAPEASGVDADTAGPPPRVAPAPAAAAPGARPSSEPDPATRGAAAERLSSLETADVRVVVFHSERDAREFMAGVLARDSIGQGAPDGVQAGGFSAPSGPLHDGEAERGAKSDDLRDGGAPPSGGGGGGSGRRAERGMSGDRAAAMVNVRIFGQVDARGDDDWQQAVALRQGRVVSEMHLVPAEDGTALGNSMTFESRVLGLVRADEELRRKAIANEHAGDDSKRKAAESKDGAPGDASGVDRGSVPKLDGPAKPGAPPAAAGKSGAPPEIPGSGVAPEGGPAPGATAPQSARPAPFGPADPNRRAAATRIVIVVVTDDPVEARGKR